MDALDKRKKYAFLASLERGPRGNTTEQVERSLRAAIVDLDFAPGEFIDKGAVCAALGVSRFPVSEALTRLAAEGLVEILPQRGSRAARIRLSEIKESMLIRQALEGMVAEIAARSLPPETLQVLRSNLEAQQEAVSRGDRPGFYGLDLEFHMILVQGLQLPRVAAAIDASRANIDRVRRLLSSPRRHAVTLAEHREIFRALEARDAQAARRAVPPISRPSWRNSGAFRSSTPRSSFTPEGKGGVRRGTRIRSVNSGAFSLGSDTSPQISSGIYLSTGEGASLAGDYAMTLQIGEVAPDFEAETTEGRIRFHDWMGDSWCVLFSHPKDFTPVCTTELGYMAKIKPEFDRRNVKVIGLSVDPVSNHARWADDIRETQGTAPNYPMIGDSDLTISKLYGMLPASTGGTSEGRTPADNQTVRNVFVVGPDKKIKLVLVYPMTTGRNFDEVLRVIDSLQLTAKHRVATPANWKQGEDVIIAGSVSDDEAKKIYPQGWKAPKPYIRIVPHPQG